MITAADVLEVARGELRTRYPGIARLGTRWKHQARVLGVALDCIGLVGATGVRLGLASAQRWNDDDELKRYPRIPDGVKLVAACRRYLIEVPLADVRDADILVFAPSARAQAVMGCERPIDHPTHFAFAGTHGGRRTMIHAEMMSRRVVENGLGGDSAFWMLRHAFRFPELAA